MSCVIDQYVTWEKNVVVDQYESIKSVLERTLDPQGWTVIRRNFITVTRSLNEQDLHDNLIYCKVPQAGFESIRSKLVFKIFDVYANILKVMYSTRFVTHVKVYYQVFFWVLIDLIVKLLVLIIKTFDNQTEN
jgi:hypothetical protein